MRSSSFLALAAMLCGAVVAVPAPTRTPLPSVTRAQELAAADGTPDCAALEDYCQCHDDDFNCETNPSCEWCREHNAWGDQPPPPPSQTTTTTM
ncbi:hypothetical protein F4819DRAFT_489946 [Hypoxylon fuscum]|nr:hypothetical protein F4819DRAFT_489946 [Hypoxylon fuscum]